MTILQLLADFGVFLGWLFSSLKTIFLCLLSPVSYIFTYLKVIIGSFFLPPATPELSYTFSSEVLDIFNAIPNWSIVSAVLGALVILIIGFATFKLILRA